MNLLAHNYIVWLLQTRFSSLPHDTTESLFGELSEANRTVAEVIGSRNFLLNLNR